MYLLSRYSLLLFVLLFSLMPMAAREKKNVKALRTDIPLKIDGVLNEPIYGQTDPAKDFVQLQPYNGKPAMQPSEVWFFFDQEVIYVGAMLYDSAPDSIFNFLTERDNTGSSDYFGVYIDPFNEGQLAFGFFITPSGVQIDVKATKNNEGGDNEDSNWNAVWESQTLLTDKGWTVEMRIPYSALRFSEKSLGVWGLNIFRNIRRYNSNAAWSLIDRKVDGFIDQQGHLTGISGIIPPIRLSVSPYLTTYFESKDEGKTHDFLYKGGLDLKYGIDASFTLDMMLIPDFGQIPSDDKQLNLSPYELYYGEKRQFFTESTELFERGDIFYSRRIGAAPKFSDRIVTGNKEEIQFNPSETQLINATKISGRTDKGWGLGFLNAMSLPSYARIKNTETNETRKVLVQPFTNYNISVVDKSLKNNSYISLINSNVSMVGHPFRANVTATEFQLRNKSKIYALSGKGGLSTRGKEKLETGYFGKLALKKNKGNFQFGVEQSLYSDSYNPNDLGYLQHNNEVTSHPWIYYQIVEPFSVFREMSGDLWWNYERVYHPGVFSNNSTGFEFNVTFRNNFRIQMEGGYQTKAYDYFEPRVKGRFFLSPSYYWYNLDLESDWRKPLSLNLYYTHVQGTGSEHYANNGELYAAFRAGQHFKIEYDLYLQHSANELGYVDNDTTDGSIHFAKRQVEVLSNTLSVYYVINNKMSLKIRGRHYWSCAENRTFYLLQKEGSLLPDPSYHENKDQNYNAFTIDMSFQWVFAPGSELALVWKDAAYLSENTVEKRYWENFQHSWRQQNKSISLKVLYYIDFSKWMKKKGRSPFIPPE